MSEEMDEVSYMYIIVMLFSFTTQYPYTGEFNVITSVKVLAKSES